MAPGAPPSSSFLPFEISLADPAVAAPDLDTSDRLAVRRAHGYDAPEAHITKCQRAPGQFHIDPHVDAAATIPDVVHAVPDQNNKAPDMELDVVEVQSFAATAKRNIAVDRFEVCASGVRRRLGGRAVGGSGSDREDVHRKQIMEVEPISEFRELRTEPSARSIAAPVMKTDKPKPPVDYARVDHAPHKKRVLEPRTSDAYPKLFGKGSFTSVAHETQHAAQEAFDPDCDVDVRYLARIYVVEERAAARAHHEHVSQILYACGGDSRGFRRERAWTARAVVAELDFPPRVSDMARRKPGYGLPPGLALDLTTCDEHGLPWDFSTKSMRDRAEALIQQQRPILLIGSSMCTAFSSWQFINNSLRDPDLVAKERAHGVVHFEWCCNMYLRQIERGSYFLHEHPSAATSWRESCVLDVLSRPGVERAVGDQCQCGQETEHGEPIKKPTGFVSNACKLIEVLGKRCFGKGGLCSRSCGGAHAECRGRVAWRAAIFQAELCEVILRGM